MSGSLRPQRSTFTEPGAVCASLTAHVLLGVLAAWLVHRASAPGPLASPLAAPGELAIDAEGMDLPGMLDGTDEHHPSPEPVDPTPPIPGGPEHLTRPDMDRDGRGGSRQVTAPALNLSDRDEGLTLTREVVSRIDRDQVQRLDTGRERASRDDRRATTQPMELTFLASGSGRRAERRPVASRDPASGVLFAAPGARLGSTLGAPAAPVGGLQPQRPMGGVREGSERASPDRGVLDRALVGEHRAAADVAHARPMVDRAAPTVPAEQMGRARDDRESEQEVASAIQSIVHASTAGGERGAGAGGEEGGPLSGSGGVEGPSSRAVPLGGSGGALFALDGSDPRLFVYTRAMLAKLAPLWERAFPREAVIEGKQGVAIVSLVVMRDGTVRDITVSRASGVPEFDANVRAAVVRAAPFGPLPPELHASSAHWSISFDARNPAVR